jgi:iron-sulfur cluster assembly accessory protein
LARLASHSQSSASAAAPAAAAAAAQWQRGWPAGRGLHSSSAAAAESASQPAEQPVAGSTDLQLTDAAVARLQALHAEGGGAAGVLRLVVEGGGCSGFQYQFSLDEAGPRPGDRVVAREGVAVVCDDVSLEFLKGATVDFESDLMRSAFVVHDNPNAAASCGCGSSFAAK